MLCLDGGAFEGGGGARLETARLKGAVFPRGEALGRGAGAAGGGAAGLGRMDGLGRGDASGRGEGEGLGNGGPSEELASSVAPERDRGGGCGRLLGGLLGTGDTAAKAADDDADESSSSLKINDGFFAAGGSGGGLAEGGAGADGACSALGTGGFCRGAGALAALAKYDCGRGADAGDGSCDLSPLCPAADRCGSRGGGDSCCAVSFSPNEDLCVDVVSSFCLNAAPPPDRFVEGAFCAEFEWSFLGNPQLQWPNTDAIISTLYCEHGPAPS